MRKCPHCGAEVPKGWETCRQCLKALPKRSFLARLFGWFGGLPAVTTHTVTQTQVTRSEYIEVVGEDGQRKVYHSLEEVPPEIRAKIEAARASSQPTQITNQITIRDESGQERTFQSIDEMPQHMRAIYERMQSRIRKQG